MHAPVLTPKSTYNNYDNFLKSELENFYDPFIPFEFWTYYDNCN